MKYIAKMMLALLASVTLVIPAYAWDFSASGSLSSTFNQISEKKSKDDDAISSMDVGSEGGAITLSSSNTDGDKSATFSYSVDYADGGLDQVLSVSGSSKVGKWTATGSVDYNLGWNGTDGSSMQGGEDAEEITITDGTLTISLGDGSFLSSTSTVTSGVAGGAVTMNGVMGDDDGIGATVGAPQRLSVGYKISDTMSGTFAYQTDSTAAIFDKIDASDGEAGGTNGYSTSASGVNLNVTAGAISAGVTVASGATAQKGTNDNASAGTTSATTMGLGLTMAMGDMTPHFSYGSTGITTEVGKLDWKETGMGLGLTLAMGSDSVVVSYTTVTQTNSTDGTEDRNATATGIELGYNTTVGAVALGVGYGSKTVAADKDAWSDDDKVTRADGYAKTDLEVKMSFSF